MAEYSILIGGKAGDGINRAGEMVARMLTRCGFRTYMYYEYPSLIRGGHNFAIVRAAPHAIAAHRDGIDFLLALDQNTYDLHIERVRGDAGVVFNQDRVKGGGTGISVESVLEAEGAPEIMGNSCLIGAFCKCADIPFQIIEEVFRKFLPKGVDQNLRVARRGYEMADTTIPIGSAGQAPLPVLTGNQAIGLGLIKGGLDCLVAYPMTPSSSILHFLADKSEEFHIPVIHPENEIAVVCMALGCAYAGKRSAVCTSGGGFCLMTEGLSLAGQAEIPVTIIESQRPGPSTGIPTYTSQSDLHFVIHAGQGEFSRLVVAPGDAEEAYYWSAIALNLSWKFQIPSLVLVDKTVSEGLFCFDQSAIDPIPEERASPWDRQGVYARYRDTPSGISPLAGVPDPGAVVKVNSYTHDEMGISTEDPAIAIAMQEKQMRKEAALKEDLGRYTTVAVRGRKESPDGIVCWGSCKGVCVELAESMGLRCIQPLVLHPFPAEQMARALDGTERLVGVEHNLTGQLDLLMKQHGIAVDPLILKYDGRPFTLDELEERVMGVMG